MLEVMKGVSMELEVNVLTLKIYLILECQGDLSLELTCHLYNNQKVLQCMEIAAKSHNH